MSGSDIISNIENVQSLLESGLLKPKTSNRAAHVELGSSAPAGVPFDLDTVSFPPIPLTVRIFQTPVPSLIRHETSESCCGSGFNVL